MTLWTTRRKSLLLLTAGAIIGIYPILDQVFRRVYDVKTWLFEDTVLGPYDSKRMLDSGDYIAAPHVIAGQSVVFRIKHCVAERITDDYSWRITQLDTNKIMQQNEIITTPDKRRPCVLINHTINTGRDWTPGNYIEQRSSSLIRQSWWVWRKIDIELETLQFTVILPPIPQTNSNSQRRQGSLIDGENNG